MVEKYKKFLELNKLSDYFKEDWNQFSLKYDKLKLLEGVKINDKLKNRKALGVMRSAYTMIVTNYGFFADLLFKLRLVEITDSNVVDTMATDGKSIFYNPEFTLSLKDSEVVFVLCHEILHNALFHFDRMGERYPQLWNIAGDYAINLLLKDMGSDNIIKMPDKVLYDEKYKEMSTEQIYEQLLPQYEENKQKFEQMVKDAMEQGSGRGSGGSGKAFGPNDVKEPGKVKGGEEFFKSEEGSGAGDEEMQDSKTTGDLKRKWQGALQQAKSKNPGSISANMDRFIKNLFKPKVNWRSELKKFVSKVMNKLNYDIPSRRFASREKYWPGVKKRESNVHRNAVIAIDTSGSISENELSLFASEMKGIFDSFSIKKCYVIWCDSHIPENGVQEFDLVDDKFDITKKLKPVGGGGTSFVPPFRWINDNLVKKGITPSFVIYFTDAYGEAPGRSMVKPYVDRVLWIITQNENPSNITWGKKILIDKLT